MASLTVWMQIKGRRSIIFVVVFWPGAIFEFVQKVDFWVKKVEFYLNLHKTVLYLRVVIYLYQYMVYLLTYSLSFKGNLLCNL